MFAVLFMVIMKLPYYRSTFFWTRIVVYIAAKNLCICGGVALNSVLNGKITREAGFDNVHIPNHPGVSSMMNAAHLQTNILLCRYRRCSE
jgi:Carbamoyltransferase N-terminus